MKKIICLFILLFFFPLINSCDILEEEPLDEILEYHITINPTEEGNLNMKYHIKWKVLDSTSEGPLEWVKIGVPNKYVSNIKSLSSSINEIKYYADSGAYIRVDLNREYYEGEVVSIDFSFLQKRIYTIKKELVEYRFIPGWFEEIKVKDLTVKWSKATTGVVNTNCDREDENYYIWSTSLDFGESINVDIQYQKQAFINISEENTYSDDDGDNSWIIAVVVFSIVIVVLFVAAIYGYIKDDGYYSYRGFSGNVHHYRWWYFHFRRRGGVDRDGKRIPPSIVNSSGGKGTSGGSCACACACACAGGGRAGCSRKDFYNPKIKVDDILKKLL